MNKRNALLSMIAGVLIGAAWLAAWAPSPSQASRSPAPVGASPALTSTQSWQDEIIDQLGLVGDSSAIALDANGFPHISYYDMTDHALKYAVWDGVGWTTDTVERGLGDFNTSFPLRSGIGVYGGTAFIVYEKSDGYAARRILRYAVGGVGGWSLSTISANDPKSYAYAPSLRLDSAHNAYVSYSFHNLLTTADQSIVYARFDFTGTNWITQTVDNANWGFGLASSLALDTGGHPQIVYGGTGFPANPFPLVHVRLSGSTWQRQTVDTDGNFPSLAVDHAGNAHIAYKTSDIFSAFKVATWTGAAWQLVDLGTCCKGKPSLALDVLDRPRIAIDNRYWQWSGSSWSDSYFRALASDATPIDGALALDGSGSPHISYLDANYSDLHHVYWASDWQTQTVALSGSEPHLALDLHSRPFIAYEDTLSPNVRLASWTAGGYWQYLNVLSNAFYNYLRLQYDVNKQPLPILSYFNIATTHLDFAQWNGASFDKQTVDSANNVGEPTSLAFDPSARPIIGYYDLVSKRIKLASANDVNASSWTLRVDMAGPIVHNPSLSTGASPVCCKTYIAYTDDYSFTLRLATWDGAQWTDELVDGNHGYDAFYVSLAVDRASGEPALAYFDVSNNALRYATRRGGLWVSRVVDSGLASENDVSLSLALGSDQYPRIAYSAAADKSLRLAWTVLTSQTITSTLPVSWTIETVQAFGNFAPSAISSQVLGRDHIVFGHSTAGVGYAFHSATLPYPLYYNPLQPCVEPQAQLATAERARAALQTMSPSDLANVDDLTAMRALRDVFALTSAGRRYINMYYQYAPETGALALSNPGLLWDAYRTLQNFLPGFKALAAGRGGDIVITQEMVDELNNIADRLVAGGSTPLKNAINQERATYNHLQDFAGKTFNQASDLSGLTPGNRVYLPILER